MPAARLAGITAPDCGAVMGDATYQKETFDEESQVEAKEK